MRTVVSAERAMPATASVVYHCLADYREHHRPSGFLPPAFSDYEIEQGGVGAGTVFSCVIVAGGTRTPVRCTVSEPEPGARLVERASNLDLQTTFTVTPAGDGASVRIETVSDAPGLRGVLNRLFVPRILTPVYRDELHRLADYAAAHAASGHAEIEMAGEPAT